jgi:hypothetical protein
MCRSALDGIHYNSRKAPAQVSGGHGVGVGRLIFVCVLWVVPSKAKFLATSSIDLSDDIGHNYAVNGPIYTI